jgi:hypothetical protein
MQAQARLASVLRWFRSLRLDPLDFVFAFCSLLALRALLVYGIEPLGIYDEGLLFTDAQMMADGRVPYRDFYANYPPGIFQIIRAVLALSDAPIWTARLLSLGVRIGTALGVAWLVGRARGPGLCLATAASVLILQAALGLAPSAYTFAVLLCLIAIVSWPNASSSPGRTLGCGGLLACVSYLRHDLFGYVVMQLLVIEALWWLLRKRSFFFATKRQLVQYALGALGTGLLLWVPLFLVTDLSRLLHDLVLDLPRLVMPSRTLPIPPLFELMSSGALNTKIPALLGDPLRLCLALSAFGALAAVYAAQRALRAAEPTALSRLTVLTAVFALGTLPQALGRTDYWHAAYGLPLLLAAGLSVVSRRVAQGVALLALLPWLSRGVQFISAEDAVRLWQSDDNLFLSGERRALKDLVQARTRPGEPIFVGCSSHRRVIIVPIDVYYWAHRPGATRYMQFDPGLVTSTAGQREMIADLERTKPRIILLFAACIWDEPNDSMLVGAKDLDDYLSVKYAPGEWLGAFMVWQRK